MSQDHIKENIVDLCKRLNAKNMLSSCDGNISFLFEEKKIFITPRGVNKAFLKAEDVCIMALDGRVEKGEPSTEYRIHLAVYNQCPEAKCVIHAHPPVAVAWSIAHPEFTELPCEALPEILLCVGKIPIIPYARPGTPKLGQNVASFAKESRTMILSRHGALSWGESLAEAYNGMERIEHAATILKHAYELGGFTPLPKDELVALQEARKTMGTRVF